MEERPKNNLIGIQRNLGVGYFIFFFQIVGLQGELPLVGNSTSQKKNLPKVRVPTSEPFISPEDRKFRFIFAQTNITTFNYLLRLCATTTKKESKGGGDRVRVRNLCGENKRKIEKEREETSICHSLFGRSSCLDRKCPRD